ncbi:protease inhibitor I42 family protein [Streptomyces ovatisporus]|uniref:Protease inhibitor I42 family protein n=1 Tax=Streptomyces ovatisporus TaxID=1128682 RepID=A0ABV9A9V0_9ACTN
MRTLTERIALPALPLLLTALLTGCGQDTYGQDEKKLQVEKGDEFSLSVPVEAARGEDWYLVSPEPEKDVVRSTGDREETEGSDDDGGQSATHYFDFEAVGEGTTRIRLLECPQSGCAGGGDAGGEVSPSPVPSGSPTPDADERGRYHTYEVTVK